jgi:hypothetical protein
MGCSDKHHIVAEKLPQSKAETRQPKTRSSRKYPPIEISSSRTTEISSQPSTDSLVVSLSNPASANKLPKSSSQTSNTQVAQVSVAKADAQARTALSNITQKLGERGSDSTQIDAIALDRIREDYGQLKKNARYEPFSQDERWSDFSEQLMKLSQSISRARSGRQSAEQRQKSIEDAREAASALKQFFPESK